MQRVAIFGGAFNPIHWGHLLIAESAFSQFTLDKVIWVPTFRPTHKAATLAKFEHRMEMVRLAVADHPGFTVSDVDGQRQGISYAIDTLEHLKPSYPDACWYWVIGIDAFCSLPRWRGSAAIAAQCFWLIAPRSQANSDVTDRQTAASINLPAASLAPELTTPELTTEVLCEQVAAQLCDRGVQLNWQVLAMPQVPISSSLVRQYCQMGCSIRYLVHERVRQYITAYKLY